MWPGELRIKATIVLHWIPFQIGSVHPLCCPMLQVAPAQGWIHVVSQASLLFRSFVQGSSFLNQKCFKFSEWLKLINKNVESEISKKMVFNYPDKNRQICKPERFDVPKARHHQGSCFTLHPWRWHIFTLGGRSWVWTSPGWDGVGINIYTYIHTYIYIYICMYLI